MWSVKSSKDTKSPYATQQVNIISLSGTKSEALNDIRCRGGASITGSGAIVVTTCDQDAGNSKRKRHQSEMSNPEIALYIEKEHLRDAEENDYMLMENLIQRRYDKIDDDEGKCLAKMKDDEVFIMTHLDTGLILACGSSSTSERLLTVVDETMMRHRDESRRHKGIRANLRRYIHYFIFKTFIL